MPTTLEQIDEARKAGYSDQDIIKFLEPDIQSGVSAGHSRGDVLSYLGLNETHPFVGPKSPSMEAREQLQVHLPGVSDLLLGPVRGLMAIPGELRDYAHRLPDILTNPMHDLAQQSGSTRPGFLGDEPLSMAVGNALMASAPAVPGLAEGVPGTLARGARATGVALREIPAVSRMGLAGTAGWMLGGPKGAAIGSALGALPDVFAALRRGWTGPAETFTGAAGGPSTGIPSTFVHAAEDLPQVRVIKPIVEQPTGSAPVTPKPIAGTGVATQPNVPAEYSTHPSPKYAHARDIRLGDYLTTRGIAAADIEALPKIKDRVEFLNDRIAQYNATRPKGAEKINPYSLKETRAGEPDLAARIGHLLNRLREK